MIKEIKKFIVLIAIGALGVLLMNSCTKEEEYIQLEDCVCEWVYYDNYGNKVVNPSVLQDCSYEGAKHKNYGTLECFTKNRK